MKWHSMSKVVNFAASLNVAQITKLADDINKPDYMTYITSPMPVAAAENKQKTVRTGSAYSGFKTVPQPG